jgi:2OG-Fe(II) oxygenase superfamily
VTGIAGKSVDEAASTAGTALNFTKFRKEVETVAPGYNAAAPFPHAVFRDMLNLESSVMADFPAPEWPSWTELGDTYQFRKFTCSNIEVIPQPFVGLIRELSDPTFLRLLEQLSGIPKLIPDPYLKGGGLHMSGPGGVLAPHTDFHLYEPLALYRRINVLVYLNDDWDASYGGCLELGDPKSPAATVVPGWGTVMVFTTDNRSIHGFPKPITEGHWRKSIALYYYTADETKEFAGDTTTGWRTHGEHHGVVNKTRLGLYKSLNQTSKAVSLAAHLVNPNQGTEWWRMRKERLAKENGGQGYEGHSHDHDH